MKKMRPKPIRKHNKYCSSMSGIWRSWWHIQFQFACLFRLFVSLSASFLQLLVPLGLIVSLLGQFPLGWLQLSSSKQPILVAFPILSGLISHNGCLGLPWLASDPAVQELALVAFWNLSASLHDFYTLRVCKTSLLWLTVSSAASSRCSLAHLYHPWNDLYVFC